MTLCRNIKIGHLGPRVFSGCRVTGSAPLRSLKSSPVSEDSTRFTHKFTFRDRCQMTPVEFEAHPLWVVLHSTLELIESATFNDEVDAPWINRVQFIASYIVEFKSDYSELFTNQGLDAVNSTWSTVIQNIQNFLQNRNVQFLQYAFTNAEAALEQTSSWVNKSPSSSQSKKIVAGYKSLLSGLEQDQKKILGSIEELRNKINDIGIREQQTDINLTARIKPLQEALNTFEARYEIVKANFEGGMVNFAEKFDQSQISQQNAFDRWLLSEQKTFESKAEPYIDKIKGLVAIASARLTEIDSISDMTKKVASMTTGDVLANKYADSAQEERKTGLYAYAGGWGGLVAGLIVYLCTVGGVSVSKLNWEEITLKFGFSAAIVGGATIAFSLGRRSLKLSSTYKRMELELRAIGPFLADVDDSDATKKSFIDRSFGRSWDSEPVKASQEDTELNVLAKILPGLLKLLGKNGK